MFYHKFIYAYLNLNHNIENEINNNTNHVCALVREGYGKGYFEILYKLYLILTFFTSLVIRLFFLLFLNL